MTWKLVLPFITRAKRLVSTHHISSLPRLHHSSLVTHVACIRHRHSSCCNLDSKFALVNNQSMTMHFTYIWARGYVKGKDRGKDKKSDKGKKKVAVNDEQLSELIEINTMRKQMQQAVDRLKEEYVKNLSLRSTTGSIETLPVSFEGKEYQLQELAQIVRKNPKTIIINMAAFPQVIPAALQSIEKSGMNLNPQQDGTALFIPIPKVTKEHRENLAKNAKALFIKCRDSIKEIQNKNVKTVKNNSTVSQDLAFSAQEQIIEVGNQYISQGEMIFDAKQAELIGKD